MDRAKTCLAFCVAALAIACQPPDDLPPTGHPPADDTPPLNVVLITIDTLRADHLGTYGYFRDTSPNIDRFAADALVVEHAIAPMATTLPSHVSMLTGAYPARHGIVSNYRYFQRTWQSSDDLRPAAEMLRDAGYTTAAFTSSSPVCAETGIDHGFTTFEGPPVISQERGRIDQIAKQAVDASISWLEDSPQEPFFLWVHVFDPHDPYRPPRPFQKFSDQPELFERVDELAVPSESRAQAAEWMNPYDGEILYTDHEIGRLLAKLTELGLDDTSAIVLTADHGESLMQHGEPRHGGLWGEQLRVPLILRFPEGPRGRLDGLASLIDILPTLAARGVPLDTSQLDGIDLLSQRRDDALSQHELNSQQPHLRLTLTERDWKYWALADQPDRLYHLATDPHETRDVLTEHPEVARRMHGRIQSLLEDNQRRAPESTDGAVNDALREQLQALGYVE